MSASATTSVRAVLVDDTSEFRELMRIALERAGGFQVVAEASDGEHALSVVREHGPELVLLDISMPVMDGLDALPHIREICPDAAVVMLSGFSASAMREVSLELGADGYVEKGQPIRKVIDRLREIVNLKLDHQGA